jgi:hypothetical protein
MINNLPEVFFDSFKAFLGATTHNNETPMQDPFTVQIP